MAFTFFMRDQPTLEQAVDRMVPYVSGRSRIKVWDAGCAQGQETYTLAMILAERMNRFGFRNVQIDATDHDSANHFGEVVSEAVYHGDELQRTPAHLLAKYFEPAAKTGYYRVRDELRNQVRFHYHNLLSLTPAGNDYCLVVCKNVLLHFQPRERVAVFRTFHKALAPGGYLATENTQKLPDEVAHLFTRVVRDARVYKKTES
ncbi:MAG: CheR family methyltransferase [Desulfurivibrionaceae bacterium]